MRRLRMEVTPGSPAFDVRWAWHDVATAQPVAAPQHERVAGALTERRLHVPFSSGALTLEHVDGAGACHFQGTLTTTNGRPQPASCWRDPPRGRYRYDAATGTCRDSAGVTGWNARRLEVLLETGEGECVDFAASGLRTLNHLGTFVTLTGWNLKGSRLMGLALTYVLLLDATLQGADLMGLTTFYHCLAGRTDAHSKAPKECAVKGAGVRCGDSCEF